MTPGRPPAFDPLLAVRVLNEHGVRFVIIGGFGARLQGSPTLTNDVDVCYARDDANLEALAAALVEMRATLRGAHEDVPFILDARTLRNGDHFTFITDAGNLDILGTPAGSPGFDELARAADRMELDGVSALVASVDDLIRMKRASARPKDLIEAEVLGALREEIEARERQRRIDR